MTEKAYCKVEQQGDTFVFTPVNLPDEPSKRKNLSDKVKKQHVNDPFRGFSEDIFAPLQNLEQLANINKELEETEEISIDELLDNINNLSKMLSVPVDDHTGTLSCGEIPDEAYMVFYPLNTGWGFKCHSNQKEAEEHMEKINYYYGKKVAHIRILWGGWLDRI